MKYKYSWNTIQSCELEKVLNELGAVGWRVVHMEWDDQSERYLVLVEKVEAKDG